MKSHQFIKYTCMTKKKLPFGYNLLVAHDYAHVDYGLV